MVKLENFEEIIRTAEFIAFTERRKSIGQRIGYSQKEDLELRNAKSFLSYMKNDSIPKLNIIFCSHDLPDPFYEEDDDYQDRFYKRSSFIESLCFEIVPDVPRSLEYYIPDNVYRDLLLENVDFDFITDDEYVYFVVYDYKKRHKAILYEIFNDGNKIIELGEL